MNQPNQRSLFFRKLGKLAGKAINLAKKTPKATGTALARAKDDFTSGFKSVNQ